MSCFPEKEVSFNCIEQGADWVQSLTLKDSNGDPINLTGATAKMQFRPTVNGDLVIDLSNGSGITLGGALGTIDMEIDNTVTDDLTAVSLVFDFFITWSTGKTDRLFYGQVDVIKRITRP
ncbi:MAG: hypothetical protein ABFD50_08160 [Smithella sp.]